MISFHLFWELDINHAFCRTGPAVDKVGEGTSVEVHTHLRLRKRQGQIKERWELLEEHCIEDAVRITQLSDPQN